MASISISLETISECLSHPVGALPVCDSTEVCIYHTVTRLYNLHAKRQANRAYKNYRQDCFIRQRYGISYESFMNNVINSLSDVQCNFD